MRLSRLAPLVSLLAVACGGSTAVPASPGPAASAPPVPAAPSVAPIASAPPPAADAGAAAAPSPSAPGSPSSEVTIAMLHALKAERGNVFFSAESVRDALGMAALGARGATLDATAKALGVDPDPKKNAAAAKTAREAWKKAAGQSELAIADALWVDKSFTLDKAFAAEALDGYGAAPAQVDFAQPEPSRARINKWVSDKTMGKIRELLPAGAVDARTRLVLTNAVYFKGKWATPFDKASTTPAPFHADGGDVSVPMMHERAQMKYAEDADAQLVELAYDDSDLAMLVALPKASASVATLEDALTGARLDAWGKRLAPSHVVLSMPRVSFTWGRSIRPELQAMGLGAAFGGDFGGIGASHGQPATLSDVFHKAFVNVDESGTEAAAATGGVMRATALVMGPTVTLDRPFLFFVRNVKTGEILFAGRVAKPDATHG